MNFVTDLFKKKECDIGSTDKTYYSGEGPCKPPLENKGGCCAQTDLGLLRDISYIYNARTTGDEHELVSDIQVYMEDIQELEYDPEHYVILDMAKPMNGKFISWMLEEYEPSIGVKAFFQKKGLFSSGTGFEAVSSQIDKVVYMTDGIKNIQVPFHKYTVVGGKNSSVSFDSITQFSDPESSEYDHMIAMTRGGSILSVGMELSTTLSDKDLVQHIGTSLLGMANALLGDVSDNKDTNFTFTFKTRTITPGLLINTLAIGDYYEESDEGVIYSTTGSEGGMSYELIVSMIYSEKSIICTLEIFLEDGEEVEEVNIPAVPLPLLVVEDVESDILKINAIDIITFEDMSVQEYLDGDESNMVILEKNNTPHFTNSKDLVVSMKEGIVYACKVANGHLQQSESNVESETELFNARRLGTLGGYIDANQVRAAMEMTNKGEGSRIFRVTGTPRIIPTVIGKDAYNGGDLVSANHCQPGAEGPIVEIASVNIKD